MTNSDHTRPPDDGPGERRLTSVQATNLWGRGAVEAAFAGPIRAVPWPHAPRAKGEPLVPRPVVAALLTGPPSLADVDPRTVYACQPSCLAQHVRYYLEPHWFRTGRTAADQGRASNRYPLLWVDDAGRRRLLGGHHRAMAALLEARLLRCRVVRTSEDDATPVLPSLLVGATSTLADRSTGDAAAAAAHIEAGRTVLVPGFDVAAEVLHHLGLDVDVVHDRLTMATHGRCTIAG